MPDFDILNGDDKFRYRMLGRLQMDCRYYLGHGNRNPENLWAGNEKEQIETMKALWHSFSEEDKPEWLTLEQIEEFGKEMLKTL